MTDYVTGMDGAREDLCRYLAACYCEPSTAFSEELLFDAMLAAASAIDSGLAESARKLGALFVAQDMQTLLVDYTALFVGPAQPRAMPYASFWLTADQSMRHEATEAALDYYAQGGFAVSEELHELPDHIAVELEFLYALIFAENQARQAGDTEKLSAADDLHRRFVTGHLCIWIDPFAAAARSGAETGFYRELAGFTERFVRLEQELS